MSKTSFSFAALRRDLAARLMAGWNTGEREAVYAIALRPKRLATEK